ncbi:helix-turn-helix domain-containing protein [Maridesulfovibrio sp. FT414]|uniref:AraC family ligand binding domain-containing protein n=1 Tax=Maridesulfovibrio sp. FT414 TaxID=2979469 RepID=UPI003D8024B3
MGSRIQVLRASYVSQNFSRHMHEDYAVGVIERGAMAFRYRGCDLVASSGQVNLVVPGEVHDGHAAEDEGWTYSMFYLPPEVLLGAAAELSKRPEQPHFRQGILDDRWLSARLLEVHRAVSCPSTSSLEKETLLLGLLTGWITRHADAGGGLTDPGHEHRAVNLAREFIEDCYERDLSLEQLASLGGLSHYHFVRVFEKETGITPHAYLMQTRVNRARGMLDSSMRLADIAAACGFFDQSHFTRHFSRQFGLTPGRYRNFIQNRESSSG